MAYNCICWRPPQCWTAFNWSYKESTFLKTPNSRSLNWYSKNAQRCMNTWNNPTLSNWCFLIVFHNSFVLNDTNKSIRRLMKTTQIYQTFDESACDNSVIFIKVKAAIYVIDFDEDELSQALLRGKTLKARREKQIKTWACCCCTCSYCWLTKQQEDAQQQECST